MGELAEGQPKVPSPRAVMEAMGEIDAREHGDPILAGIASRQHGLVTLEQLKRAGLGPGAIAHRVGRGRLHRVHRGVYLLGHSVPPLFAVEMAAVLAVGGGAALSHRSAAALWSMCPCLDDHVEVSVTGSDRRSRPGVLVHQVGRLEPRDLTRRHGVPITTPVRTLIDLGEVLGARDLERAYAEAVARRRVTHRLMRGAIRRDPTKPGAPAFHRLLEQEHEPAHTRSDLEDLLLGIVRTARLPEPRTNVWIGRFNVDAYWPASCLVVEVDSRTFHSSPAAFENDRARDATLAARGITVIRVTWRQIEEEAAVVVARIAQALVRGEPARRASPPIG